MSFCDWVSSKLFGKTVEVTPAAPEEKPPETFCRSNRYNDWLTALNKDIKHTQATRIEIKCYNNDTIYRGVCSIGYGADIVDAMEKSITLFDCNTLLPVSLSDIYEQGVECGKYLHTTSVYHGDEEDYRHRDPERHEIDPQTYQVMPRFTNQVHYKKRPSHHHLMHRHYKNTDAYIDNTIFPGVSQLLVRFKVAEEWNKTKLIVLGKLDNGSLVLTPFDSYDKIEYKSLSRSVSIMLYNEATDEAVLPHTDMLLWVMEEMMKKAGTFELYCGDDKKIVTLFDPIRVIRLKDDEDVGSEAYVALVEGKMKDTFTRQRFRIEVDSEVLYKGMIVNLGKLYQAASNRLALERCEMNGRLYVDNIRYLLKDGSEHSSSPAGFSDIGAEPFLPKWERVYFTRAPRSDHDVPSGPFIITNELYPEAPTY
jgi:hypothetical protein